MEDFCYSLVRWGTLKATPHPFYHLTEWIGRISPHLNKHLYLLESPLVINRSVARSCIYQVHPAQMSVQGHPFKQGQEKYASPDTKGKESIQVKTGPPSASLCPEWVVKPWDGCLDARKYYRISSSLYKVLCSHISFAPATPSAPIPGNSLYSLIMPNPCPVR